MARRGTVCLLGAGASADAGYPLATQLLPEFAELVKAKGQRELRLRGKAAEYRSVEATTEGSSQPGGKFSRTVVWRAPAPQLDAPTIEDKFKLLWAIYERYSSDEKLLAIPRFKEGRPQLGAAVMKTAAGIMFSPYTLPRESNTSVPTTLEGFFSFYDLVERQILRGLFSSLRVQKEIEMLISDVMPQNFRTLREVGLQSTYEELAPFKHKLADYLAPLLSIPGPLGHPVVASLNFDLTLECIATKYGLGLFDGFRAAPVADLPRPSTFEKSEGPNLVKLWDTARSNLCPYVGFKSVANHAVELLKLHGSLGWFTIEEGSGDIGNRSDLRQNSVYAHMRLPIDVMARAGKDDGNVQDLAVGGPSDLAMQSADGWTSRKAGAVWLRPSMVFARATKLHSDALWIDLFGRFSLALGQAKNVLVMGYSWGDVHINDMLLNAVAQGITLIDVSRECPSPHILGLIAQRFPTTFRETSSRVYMFGGGARRVLGDGEVILPSKQQRAFDLPAALSSGNELPGEYSLRDTLRS